MKLRKQRLFCLVGILLCNLTFITSIVAQTTHYVPEGDQLPGPECLAPVKPVQGRPKTCTPDDYKVWLDDISHWRSEMRIRAGFSV